MAVVKLKYLKERPQLKRHLRYITHRRGREGGANLAMTSVTPVCTLADLILYVATRTALIAARRRT